jgi:hypothetical protein
VSQHPLQLVGSDQRLGAARRSIIDRSCGLRPACGVRRTSCRRRAERIESIEEPGAADNPSARGPPAPVSSTRPFTAAVHLRRTPDPGDRTSFPDPAGVLRVQRGGACASLPPLHSRPPKGGWGGSPRQPHPTPSRNLRGPWPRARRATRAPATQTGRTPAPPVADGSSRCTSRRVAGAGCCRVAAAGCCRVSAHGPRCAGHSRPARSAPWGKEGVCGGGKPGGALSPPTVR